MNEIHTELSYQTVNNVTVPYLTELELTLITLTFLINNLTEPALT